MNDINERIADVRERVRMGLIANNGAMAIDANGTDWKNDYCECDREVGAAPCRYCAVDAALRKHMGTCNALEIAVNALEKYTEMKGHSDKTVLLLQVDGSAEAAKLYLAEIRKAITG